MKFSGAGGSPTAMRTVIGLVLALALFALTACDVCDVARELHQDRCDDGIEASCQWLDEHVLDSGACVGLRRPA